VQEGAVGGFRHFIVRTAEVMMFLVVIFMTLGFAISGAGTAHATMGGIGWLIGLLVGGVIGFISAAVIAAYFFLLAEIAENTRRAP
jgi:hypothetical protein